MDLKLTMLTIILACFSSFAFGQQENTCEAWKRLLMFGEGKESNLVSQATIKEVEIAINCLMEYKRNFEINEHWIEYTNESAWEEYDAKISLRNHFHYGSNQFTAMYLISAFYYGSFEFTKRIELVERNIEKSPFTDLHRISHPDLFQKLFSPKTRNGEMTYRVDRRVSNMLFKLYENWVGTMNENGLEYMRKNNLNPLKGTDYQWHDAPH